MGPAAVVQIGWPRTEASTARLPGHGGCAHDAREPARNGLVRSSLDDPRLRIESGRSHRRKIMTAIAAGACASRADPRRRARNARDTLSSVSLSGTTCRKLNRDQRPWRSMGIFACSVAFTAILAAGCGARTELAAPDPGVRIASNAPRNVCPAEHVCPGPGRCVRLWGVAWDGNVCGWFGACPCIGIDCAAVRGRSFAECQRLHDDCATDAGPLVPCPDVATCPGQCANDERGDPVCVPDAQPAGCSG